MNTKKVSPQAAARLSSIHEQNRLAATDFADRPARERDIVRLQIVTIVWMAVEVVVSLTAAWHAHSPALLGFGGDSLIELFSAIVVLWRFRFSASERLAAQIAGMLLFVLAAFVTLASVLNLLGYRESKPSIWGIAILLAAAVGMPWLAKRKRRLAVSVSSAALRADAAESALCGYMAWISLTGLAVNGLWNASWADPLAALALIPIIVKEGYGAYVSANTCCSCD